MDGGPNCEMNELGDLLRRFRRRRQLGLLDLGIRLGYSESALARFESGANVPPAGLVADVVRELDLNELEATQLRIAQGRAELMRHGLELERDRVGDILDAAAAARDLGETLRLNMDHEAALNLLSGQLQALDAIKPYSALRDVESLSGVQVDLLHICAKASLEWLPKSQAATRVNSLRGAAERLAIDSARNFYIDAMLEEGVAYVQGDEVTATSIAHSLRQLSPPNTTWALERLRAETISLGVVADLSTQRKQLREALEALEALDQPADRVFLLDGIARLAERCLPSRSISYVVEAWSIVQDDPSIQRRQASRIVQLGRTASRLDPERREPSLDRLITLATDISSERNNRRYLAELRGGDGM